MSDNHELASPRLSLWNYLLQMGKESHLGQIAKGSSLVGMSVMGYLALSRWLQTDTVESSSQVVPTETSQAGDLATF